MNKNQQKEKDETTVTFDTAQNTIIIDSSDLEKSDDENSEVLDNNFETELSSEIIEEPTKESEIIQTDFSEFPETEISDEIDSTSNFEQEEAENTEKEKDQSFHERNQGLIARNENEKT